VSYPAVFQYAKASPEVTALLGSVVTRFWPFDIAPSPDEDNYTLPYSTHQRVYGSPDNTLSCPPSADLQGIQIDAYAATASGARAVVEALRDAMEPHGYVVSLLGDEWEQATGLYRSGFTVEFWTQR
jgi:uncharacterized protein DUF3168